MYARTDSRRLLVSQSVSQSVSPSVSWPVGQVTPRPEITWAAGRPLLLRGYFGQLRESMCVCPSLSLYVPLSPLHRMTGSSSSTECITDYPIKKVVIWRTNTADHRSSSRLFNKMSCNRQTDSSARMCILLNQLLLLLVIKIFWLQRTL
jgi:hypothetical protein